MDFDSSIKDGRERGEVRAVLGVLIAHICATGPEQKTALLAALAVARAKILPVAGEAPLIDSLVHYAENSSAQRR